MKYYLFNFSNNRVSVKKGILREVEINESEKEIISDIVVFEENSFYENYTLVFELIPENKSDIEKIPKDLNEILSISIFSFRKFEIVEIPFKKID